MRPIDGDALLEKFNRKADIWTALTDEDTASDFAFYCKLADAIEEMPTIGGWISVKDKKRPHICSLVLAVWENAYGFQKVRMSVYDKYKGEEIWSDRPDGYHITHWQPLPKPPKEEDG